MFCPNCGKEITENMKFCPGCGNPVNGLKPESVESKKKGPDKKRKGPILFAVIAGIILSVAIVTAIFFTLAGGNAEKKYTAFLENGNKYLEEMDYTKAEECYLKAIEIRPKEKEAYMKLADVYMAQDEQEKATEILKKAIANIDEKDSEDVVERYNLYSYVDQVLIPQLGKVGEGTYECNYDSWGDSFVLYPVSTERGVMNWQIADYDGDGVEELLVLVLNNQADASQGDEIPRNKVVLQMYASEGGKVVLKDEYEGLNPVLGCGDQEDDGIFLKRNENLTYICGSNYSKVETYADGVTVKSFILSYQEGKFVQEAGLEQATSSSTPEDYGEIIERMCEVTEQLNLTVETEQLRASGWPRFLFTDEVDKTLLRIVGHNEGADMELFNQTYQPEYLGKIVLELKYGELAFETGENTEESDEQEDAIQEVTPQEQTTDISGNWTIDSELTNANNENSVQTEFGTGISYGYNITFNEDGSFSWYIGIGNGGEGTYVNEDGQIYGTYVSYEDGSENNISMTISDDTIIMNIWGDDSYFVYWKKQ